MGVVAIWAKAFCAIAPSAGKTFALARDRCPWRRHGWITISAPSGLQWLARGVAMASTAENVIRSRLPPKYFLGDSHTHKNAGDLRSRAAESARKLCTLPPGDRHRTMITILMPDRPCLNSVVKLSRQLDEAFAIGMLQARQPIHKRRDPFPDQGDVGLLDLILSDLDSTFHVQRALVPRTHLPSVRSICLNRMPPSRGELE